MSKSDSRHTGEVERVGGSSEVVVVGVVVLVLVGKDVLRTREERLRVEVFSVMVAGVVAVVVVVSTSAVELAVIVETDTSELFCSFCSAAAATMVDNREAVTVPVASGVFAV